MLCVDLTEQVLAEAVASHADHIICYSPVISPEQPLRKVSMHDPTARRAQVRAGGNGAIPHPSIRVSRSRARARGGCSSATAHSRSRP